LRLGVNNVIFCGRCHIKRTLMPHFVLDFVTLTMADAAQTCTAESPSTPRQPLERLDVEEPNEGEDNINWPSGHKLWLNMASVFMTQIVLGLVECSSFDERTLLTLTFRTSLLWLLPCPVSRINSIQWPTLVGIRQLSMFYKPSHLSSKAN